MKKLLFILFLTPFLSIAQLKSYSVEQLDSLQYVESRPVFFFIHTDWCSFCLAMENDVLNSASVSNVLNNEYYTVLLDAEFKKDIVFKGKRYVYKANGEKNGKHELAMLLAKKDGTVSFPSVVIMAQNRVVYKNNSFMNEEEVLKVITKVITGLNWNVQ